MLTIPQPQRHTYARAHADLSRIAHGTESVAIKDRLRTCVAQDRFEALGLDAVEPEADQAETAPEQETDEAAAEGEVYIERLLLLEAVSESSAIIRSGLDLCQRIAEVVGKESQANA